MLMAAVLSICRKFDVESVAIRSDLRPCHSYGDVYEWVLSYKRYFTVVFMTLMLGENIFHVSYA